MESYKTCDIDTLLLKCREQDDEAFDQLVTRYTPMMRKVVSTYLSPPYDFGELFSEACVALHVAAGRFDINQNEVTFGLYARICVRNRIVDLLRLRDHTISEQDVEQIYDDVDPEGELVKRETVDRILSSAKDLLSEYEYRVLLLHIQGYKTAAIADMLSRSAKSVDNAKARLFKRLRAEIGGISDL